MKIEDRVAAEQAARENRTQETRRGTAAEGVEVSRSAAWAAGPAGDQVQLSTLAGRIRDAMETIASQHAARLAQVAGEVQAGRYEVDVGRLSRAMLSSVGM